MSPSVDPSGSTDPVTVDLGPTRTQLVSAFVWAAIGLVLGLAFVWFGSAGGDGFAIVIGVVITWLAAVSSFLEYRHLPGALIRIDADRVVVQPRRGDHMVVPTRTVGTLRIEYAPPLRRGFGRRHRRPASDLPPGWWLLIEPGPDAPRLPGHHRAFAIGVDVGRVQQLDAAAMQFGLAVGAPKHGAAGEYPRPPKG